MSDYFAEEIARVKLAWAQIEESRVEALIGKSVTIETPHNGHIVGGGGVIVGYSKTVFRLGEASAVKYELLSDEGMGFGYMAGTKITLDECDACVQRGLPSHPQGSEPCTVPTPIEKCPHGKEIQDGAECQACAAGIPPEAIQPAARLPYDVKITRQPFDSSQCQCDPFDHNRSPNECDYCRNWREEYVASHSS